MYKILDFLTMRTANFCVNEKIIDEFIDEKIFSASRTLYESMKKQGSGDKIGKSVKKYQNRARYRTTPFGLFSSVSFQKKICNSNLNKIIIDKNFYAFCKIHPEWIFNVVTKIKKSKFSLLTFQWNKNIVKKTKFEFYNNWPIEAGSHIEHIKIPYNKIIDLISDFTSEEIKYEFLIKQLNDYFENKISNNVYSEIVKFLISNNFLLTNLDKIIYYKNIRELVNCLKKNLDSLYVPEIEDLIKSLKNLNNIVSQINIKDIECLERKMEQIAKSNNYVYFDSLTNISEFHINYEETEDQLQPLFSFLNLYTCKVPFRSRYTKDLTFFYEEFGDVKVKFSIFYEKYLKVRQVNCNLAVEENGIAKYIFNKLIEHMQINGDKEFNMADLEKNIAQQKTYANDSSYSFQFHCFINRYENNQLLFTCAPAKGNNGIGRSEGRFSYIDREYFEELKKKDRKIYNKANVDIVTLNYMPLEVKNLVLMNEIYDNEKININFMNDNMDLKLENVYIGVENNRLIFYYRHQNEFKVVSFERYDLINIFGLAPKMVEDMIFWSKNYYNDIFKFFNDFNEIRKKLTILPTIKYKDIILFNKTWIVRLDMENKKNKFAFHNYMKKIRNNYKIDDIVFARVEDMGFLVNLEKESEVDYIYELYLSNNLSEIYLEDANNLIDNLVTEDKEGNHYLTEMVFNIEKKDINKIQLNSKPLYLDKKRHLVESQKKWFQLNIYLENKYQLDFIKGNLKGLIEENDYANDSFFYIRYFDGRDHIRLRFYSPEKEKYDKLTEYFIDSIPEIDVLYGTYKPEIERYGGVKLIRQAEDFFCADSRLCIDIISKFDNIDYKIKINIFFTEIILKSFCISVDEQLEIINMNYSNREFQSEFRKNSNDYFNFFELAYSSNFSEFIFNTGIDSKIVAAWRKALDKYATLVYEENNDYLRKDITLSLIHMMCIRMFGVNSKEEKMVLNIQNRTIRKRIAIKKYSKGEENIHGI